jgi:hypothetical protein
MTVASLNLGSKQFVVLPRKEFDKLQQENARLHSLLKEDAALGKLAQREWRAFKKSGGKGTSWEQVKRELGL